ncbi:MAG: DNA/RNA non-specific endonuclease [Deltaproteobacteria bacterium]
MAKFRRGHGGETKRGGKPKLMSRSIILILFLLGFLLAIIVFANKKYFSKKPVIAVNEDIFIPLNSTSEILPEERFFLPGSTTGEIVHHRYFSLSYNEKYEQSEWVSYMLSRESLKIENVKRHDRFDPDLKIGSRSAIYFDYSGSGYTRGHLAPAADMAFNEVAMKESFLMSNISPQKKEFNNGIWNELEEHTRNWAWKNDRVFIVTGPVLNKEITRFIGKNRVGVPDLFFKIILDADDPERKAIGFILPNELSTEPLSKYAVSIDSIEALTGIDFFPDFFTPGEQVKLESGFDLSLWDFNPVLYKKRIEVWNNQ